MSDFFLFLPAMKIGFITVYGRQIPDPKFLVYLSNKRTLVYTIKSIRAAESFLSDPANETHSYYYAAVISQKREMDFAQRLRHEIKSFHHASREKTISET